MYRIRWTNDANNAKPGKEPTNESYYPEDWISTKENISLHQECKIVEPHRSGMPGDGEAMSVGVHHASQALQVRIYLCAMLVRAAYCLIRAVLPVYVFVVPRFQGKFTFLCCRS